MTASPLVAYRALVADGAIRADPVQEQAAVELDDLAQVLAEYSPQMGRGGWMARLGLGRRPAPMPRGLYLWGGVGRGKSMLMEVFYEHAGIEARTHIHFHAFMQEVHRRLHNFRQAAKAGKISADRDPIPGLARVIADKAWLLCFDEMQVTDIADAMILGRLFEALFEHGVIVVTTSNRPPRDLYKDGLQRDRFLPFIDIIKDRMAVLELDSGTDYRLEKMRGMRVYMTPDNAQTAAELEEDFRRLTTGAEPAPRRVLVNGRQVTIPLAAEGAALASFADLCQTPLGPADYLEIASQFHTIVLKGIPLMGAHMRNEAKRFMTLIDALYEAKTNLICSAAAPPDDLYGTGDGAFEFERAASRLIEMQSEAYMAQAHVSAVAPRDR